MRWMVPFAMSIREAGSSSLKTFKGIAADDMHNIQTHVPYMEWLVSLLLELLCLVCLKLGFNFRPVHFNLNIICIYIHNLCVCVHVQMKIGLKQ